LYNKGFSSIEILQKLNLPVSVRSIQRFLKKQGVPIRTRSDAFMLAIKKGRMDYENLRKDKRAGESRKGIGDKLRYQIMERDNFRCVFCGQGAKDGVALQIDHIIRPENGGDNSEKNLRLLCMSCNKGRYLYEKKNNL
jgi:HNH endonuclease